MNQLKSTGDVTAFASSAAEHIRAAITLCNEDGQLRAFKYLLERLTVGGLRMDEVPGLRKIGKTVFAGSNPSAAAKKVINDASASPLAVVIASAALAESRESRQRTLLGAALGAHASVAMAGGAADPGMVVYAATIGAATAETTPMIHNFVKDQWEQFGTRD